MIVRISCRRVVRAATALACAALCLSANALDISDRYRSPRNPERRVRASTRLIVLHTTEAPARSSLNKVSDRGECHYCVTESGQIYRIVDRDREAFHAGRSMWQGVEDVDKYSVGIECVGYHNKVMPMVQIAAIRDLVKELKRMYRIPDQCVVCHSHVAYGAPNRWHRFKHRGRKRCGMLFAMPSVRRQLGLAARPAFDPDTRAGRVQSRLCHGFAGSFNGNVLKERWPIETFPTQERSHIRLRLGRIKLQCRAAGTHGQEHRFRGVPNRRNYAASCAKDFSHP